MKCHCLNRSHPLLQGKWPCVVWPFYIQARKRVSAGMHVLAWELPWELNSEDTPSACVHEDIHICKGLLW